MKFKEWDRVVVDAPHLGVYSEKGTVLGRPANTAFIEYPVRLDSEVIKTRHSCYGLCEGGYGLFIMPRDLTLITNKPA